MMRLNDTEGGGSAKVRNFPQFFLTIPLVIFYSVIFITRIISIGSVFIMGMLSNESVFTLICCMLDIKVARN